MQNGEYIKDVLHPICNTEIVTEQDIATAHCSVILDRFGECKIIAADMGVHRCITPELIHQNQELLKSTPLIAFDANLSIETIEEILQVAKDNDRPVFFEPTDMRIAEKPFVLPAKLYKTIKFMSPNLYELRNVAKYLGYQKLNKSKSLDPAFIEASEQSILNEVTLLAQFMSDKVENLIVTLGT